MDNSVRGEQRSNTQQPNSFLVRGAMFFDRIETWLAGFFQMTQEEQNDAGVYIGDERDE